MAFDVQRFNELTKQMSAYAHHMRSDHVERVAAGAERRALLDSDSRCTGRQAGGCTPPPRATHASRNATGGCALAANPATPTGATGLRVPTPPAGGWRRPPANRRENLA
jgi:hypothetical protein